MSMAVYNVHLHPPQTKHLLLQASLNFIKKSKAAAKSSKSSSASSDDEPVSKKESAKRKQVQSKGATKRKLMGAQMDVTLDKTGKKAVKTNQVHPFNPAGSFACLFQ